MSEIYVNAAKDCEIFLMHYVNSYLRKGQITMELTDHIQALKHVTEFLFSNNIATHADTAHLLLYLCGSVHKDVLY